MLPSHGRGAINCETIGGAVDIAEAGQIILRLAHGLAAAVWVGGGAYYVLAVRPNVQNRGDEQSRALGAAVQREFGEWAAVATVVMISSGVILMFERLTGGQGTTVYVTLLTIKIVVAAVAFWMTGVLRSQSVLTKSKRTGKLDTAWIVLGLSVLAFLLGALLTTLYPAEIG